MGSPQHNPPSRFLGEIPDRLMDWRRLGSAVTSWQNSSATARYRERNRIEGFASRVDSPRAKKSIELAVGDKILHTSFGLGTVKKVTGSGSGAKAEVDFGSMGAKLLAVQFAPIEKLD